MNHQIIYQNYSRSPRTIIVKVPNLSTSIVSLWFQAGSRYSSKDKDGLSHLFEHLFLVHNSNYVTKSNFLEDMENNGYIYNAYTAKDLVNYHFICAIGNEIAALKELLHAYKTIDISEKQLQYEKKIIKNEEERNRMSPAKYIWRLADQELWKNTNLSSDTFGTTRTQNNITLTDINNFRKLLYRQNNMTIIILTPLDISCESFLNIIEFNDEKKVQFESIMFSTLHKEIQNYNSSENYNVIVSYRSKELSFEKRVLMDFVAHYLAGGWSSRLIQQLRLEKNITYWVNSKVYNSYDASSLQFYYTVRGKSFNQSIEIITQEMEKLRTIPMGQETLENMKRSFMIKQLIKMNNPYEALGYYGRFALTSEKKVRIFDEYIHILDQINSISIRDFFATYAKETERTITSINSN